jgi:hypothetical protein
MMRRQNATAAILFLLLALLFGGVPTFAHATPSLLSARTGSPAPRTDRTHRLTHPDGGEEVAGAPGRIAIVRVATSRTAFFSELILGSVSVPHRLDTPSLLALSAIRNRTITAANGVAASPGTPRAPPSIPMRQ